ncbi:NAD(P)(+) transhydrogenase (Re/Si-specific) subunit beta [Desertibaculum subflavum]|uniref:NAD(P)(+) transhydrogenase (Re/Si-specific) subunit beta n=1 Tax=Desertibaculum subflavum TaxID=2268458 RepID=UPI000E6697A9
MPIQLTAFLYLVSSVLFVLALRGLSSPESSRQGNIYGMTGMTIAVVTTVLWIATRVGGTGSGFGAVPAILIALAVGGAVGTYLARTIQMTAMPQLVAAMHSLVGLAAVLVAAAAYYNPEPYGILEGGVLKVGSRVEMALGVVIGIVTFSGSIVAFAKLQGLVSGSPVVFSGQHKLNAALGLVILALIVGFCITPIPVLFWAMIALALVVGFLVIIPIGGADMPVVVSMLNSYSGWAAAGIGFTLQNPALIVTGALVGSSGAILSYIMCKGMNRSLFNVILGGFGSDTSTAAAGAKTDRPYKAGSADDAAFIMKNAGKVIIVPGYGMAVSQAQHSLREMCDKLKEEGVEVKYAIHPVAGRMPGHMNVLLAEANVPYDEVFELEEINAEFQTADVAFVIGANDVTNPAARDDPKSPIFGMPILDVDKSKTVLFVKRSMASGYAGIDNDLFYKDNTMMLLADGKKMVEDIVKSL